MANSTITITNASLGNITTDEEFFLIILDHIRPKYYQWIYLVLFMIVFITGLVGNFLVCYSVWKNHSLKTVTNFFLVNLAAADFLVILVCLPATVINDTIQSWFLGAFMCKLTIYLQRVSVFVSVLTLMAISVERYMAICHPLFHQGNHFKTRLIILIIWVISLATPSIDFYNKVLIPDDIVPVSLRPWLTACAPYDEKMEMIFNLFISILFYLIPLIVMTFTYVSIAMCLWSSTSTRSAISQNLQYESAMEQLKVRRRTAKMLIIVVVMFGLCYFPINGLNVLRYLTDLGQLDHSDLIFIFWTSRFLCYFNSAINPVIYNFMSAKFRKQFKTACFGCYKCCACFDDNEKDKRRHRAGSMNSIPSRTNHTRVTTFTSSRHS